MWLNFKKRLKKQLTDSQILIKHLTIQRTKKDHWSNFLTHLRFLLRDLIFEDKTKLYL